MNKSEAISFYKKQINSAKILKQVSMQNFNIATQIESEANRALELLGAKPERTRKGQVELSESTKLKLSATLTKL